MSTIRQRAAASFGLLAEACKRVGSEYRDLGREQRGAQSPYAVSIGVSPLTASEIEGVLRQIAGPGADLTDAQDNMPDEALLIHVGVSAPSADAAATRSLSIIREALHELGIAAKNIAVEASIVDPTVLVFAPDEGDDAETPET